MTMDGKSALLSMKSGFDVLVTLIQIVITKCTVISKTECPSMYNLKSQFTPSFRKHQCPAVSWDLPCLVSLPRRLQCVIVKGWGRVAYVCVFSNGTGPSNPVADTSCSYALCPVLQETGLACGWWRTLPP